MLYCDKCGKEKGYSLDTGPTVLGTCEICGFQGQCFDTDRGYLVDVREAGSAMPKDQAQFEEVKARLIDAYHQMCRSEKGLENENGPRLEREIKATWDAYRFCLLEAGNCMRASHWAMTAKRLLDAKKHYGAITHHLMLKALTDRGIVWAEEDKMVVEKKGN